MNDVLCGVNIFVQESFLAASNETIAKAIDDICCLSHDRIGPTASTVQRCYRRSGTAWHDSFRESQVSEAIVRREKEKKKEKEVGNRRSQTRASRKIQMRGEKAKVSARAVARQRNTRSNIDSLRENLSEKEKDGSQREERGAFHMNLSRRTEDRLGEGGTSDQKARLDFIRHSVDGAVICWQRNMLVRAPVNLKVLPS